MIRLSILTLCCGVLCPHHIRKRCFVSTLCFLYFQWSGPYLLGPAVPSSDSSQNHMPSLIAPPNKGINGSMTYNMTNSGSWSVSHRRFVAKTASGHTVAVARRNNIASTITAEMGRSSSSPIHTNQPIHRAAIAADYGSDPMMYLLLSSLPLNEKNAHFQPCPCAPCSLSSRSLEAAATSSGAPYLLIIGTGASASDRKGSALMALSSAILIYYSLSERVC